MSTASSTLRRFEFVEGTSSKYWEIQVNGKETVVRFGRIGTNGQTIAKAFTDAAAATQHAEKMIQEKLAKGYRETS